MRERPWKRPAPGRSKASPRRFSTPLPWASSRLHGRHVRTRALPRTPSAPRSVRGAFFALVRPTGGKRHRHRNPVPDRCNGRHLRTTLRLIHLACRILKSGHSVPSSPFAVHSCSPASGNSVARISSAALPQCPPRTGRSPARRRTPVAEVPQSMQVALNLGPRPACVASARSAFKNIWLAVFPTSAHSVRLNCFAGCSCPQNAGIAWQRTPLRRAC